MSQPSLANALLAAVGLALAGSAAAQTTPYSLKPNKPYAGATVRVLAEKAPQFTGIRLRDKEFTDLTGIKVEWISVPFRALQEKVAAVGASADSTIDVVNYLDSWGPAYANWLMPLDDRLKRDGISMDRYPPAFAKSATFDGNVYGLPLRAHPQLLFYRKDLFEKAGLKAPSTWAEAVVAGKKIQEQNSGVSGMSCMYGADGSRQNLFVWLNFLWGAGADLFDAKSKPAWTSPAALTATREYVELHSKHGLCQPGAVSAVEQDARVAFQQGKTAMVPMWWRFYGAIGNPKESQLKPEQVAFVAMPAYKAGNAPVTYAISLPFSISTHSKQKDAAWEFMKWLSNPVLEKRNAIERSVAGTPISNNVVTHKANLVDPEINAANGNIQYAAAISLKESNVMPQMVSWPEVGDLLSSAINKAAAGGDVNAVMQDAATSAQRVLRRAAR